MTKKSRSNQKSNAPITNRRARFDYELDEEVVAGMALSGPEVRAARQGHIQLKGSFVTVKDNELWLNNASFSIDKTSKTESGRTVDTSPRKLLASRKQITMLSAHKKDGMTIVPTKLLNQGKYIKLVIALGKGKKRWDKREAIKRRDLERDTRR